MAKQLNVDMRFTADTSKAKQAIQELQNSIQKLGYGMTPKDNLIDPKKFEQASAAARELAHHLNNAYNANTGNLDLGKLNSSLKAAKTDLGQLTANFNNAGEVGREAFINLANAIASADQPAISINSHLSLMWTTLKNVARFQISSSIMHGLIGGIQTAYRYAQDLNESLNNIRIVTGQNIDQMAKFANEANKAARTLSASTLDYANASLIYYQQGLNDQQVKERTDVTIKMANVARESAETVSEQMTAIWNNFDDGSHSLEYYADVITALGAATASSSSEISQGLEKFAAIADTVGLSYENATAALATITATTRQSADTVGTGLRTLFSRLQGLSLGETLEDGVDLNKYSKALQMVGVQALDSTGNLRKMDDVLEDLGERWGQLTEAQQTALAQTVGGVRQYTTLIALMDNWDFMKQNQLVAAGAEGTLQKQAEIYAESWEAARDRVQAATEAIYSDLINDQFFIKLTNGIEQILTGVDTFIDKFGGVQNLLKQVLTFVLMMTADRIGPAVQRLVQNIQVLVGGAQQVYGQMNAQMNDAIIRQVGTGGYTDKQVDNLTVKAGYATAKTKVSMLPEYQQEQFSLDLEGLQLRGQQLIEENDAIDKQKQLIQQLQEASKQAANETQKALDAEIEKRQQAIELERKQLEEKASKFDATAATQHGIAKNAGEQLDSFRSTLTDRNFTEGVDFSVDKNGYAHRIKQYEDEKSKAKELDQILKELNKTRAKQADAESKAHVAESQAAKYRERINKDLTTRAKNLKEEAQASTSVVAATQKQSEADKNLSAAEAQLDEQTKKHKKAVDDYKHTVETFNPQPMVSGITALSSAAAGLSGIVMTLNSLKTLIDTLNDQDATGMEKFTAILMTLSMLIPNLIGVYRSYNTVKTWTVALTTGEVTSLGILHKARSKDTAATIQQILANDKLNKGLKVAGIMRVLEGIGLEHNTAKTIANTVVTKGLSAALSELGLSMGTVALVAAGVVAGLALLYFAIKKIIEIHKELEAQKPENVYKRTQEAAQKTKDAANDLTSAVADLKNKWDSLNSAKDTLKDLTKGTDEWNQKVLEINQNILDLIHSYPMLAQYLDTSGDVWSIDSKGYEEQLNKLTTAAETMQKGSVINSALNLGASAAVTTNDKVKDLSLSSDYNYLNTSIEEWSTLTKRKITTDISADGIINEILSNLKNGIDMTEENEQNWSDTLQKAKNLNPDKFNTLVANLQNTLDTEAQTKSSSGKAVFTSSNDFGNNEAYWNYLTQQGLLNPEEFTNNILAAANKYKKDNNLGQKFLEATGLNDVYQAIDNEIYDLNGNKVESYTADMMAQILAANDVNQFDDENIADAKELIDNLTQDITTMLLDQGVKDPEIINKMVADAVIDKLQNGNNFDLKSYINDHLPEVQTSVLEGQINQVSTVGELIDLNAQLHLSEEKLTEGYRHLAAQTEEGKDALAEYNWELERAGDNLEEQEKATYKFQKAIKDIQANKAAAEIRKISENLEDLSDWDAEKIAKQMQTVFGKSITGEFVEAHKDFVNQWIDGTEEQKQAVADWIQTINDARDIDPITIQTDTGVLDVTTNEILQFASAIEGMNPTLFVNGHADMTEVITELASAGMAGETLANLLASIAETDVEFDDAKLQEVMAKVKELGPFPQDSKADGYEDAVAEWISGFAGAIKDLGINVKSFDVPTGGIPEMQSGSSGGGSGGGGSQNEAKTHKTTPKDARYKNVNNKQAQVRSQQENIAAKAEREVGQARIDLLTKEIDLQKEQVDLQRQYVDEIKKYAAEDRKALEDALNNANLHITPIFDEDGVITNYEQIVAEYNRVLEQLGNTPMTDDAFNEAKERLDKALEALDKYTETNQKLYDEEKKFFEEQKKIIDLQLEIVSRQVDDGIKATERNISLLDFMLKNIEDDAYAAADALALIGQKGDQYWQQILDYQKGIADILQGRDISDITDEKELDQLEEYANQLLDVHDNLLDIRDSLEEGVIDAFEKLNDVVQKSYDRFGLLDDTLEHYKNLVELSGGILDNNLIDQIADAQLAVNLDKISSLQEQIANMQSLLNDPTLTNEQRENYQEHLNELMAEYYQEQENGLQLLADTYEREFDRISETLDKWVDQSEQVYSRQKELNEQYLDDYEKTYELNKLNRDLNKTLDSTSNIRGRNRLLELQKEINDAMADGVKMSEYDVGFLQKKLDLEKARLDLENAQTASTQLQLQRNADGSWGYVFTADEDKIAEAQQRYDDAQHEIYEYQKQQEDKLTSQMIGYANSRNSELQQLENDRRNGNITEEEYNRRKEAIQNHYGTLMAGAVQQTSNLFGNNNWANSLYSMGLSSSVSESDLAAILESDDLDAAAELFANHFTTAEDNYEKARQLYQNDVLQYLEKINGFLTGEDIADITTQSGQVRAETSRQISELADTMVVAQEEFTNNLESINKKLKDFEAILSVITEIFKIRNGESGTSLVEINPNATAPVMDTTPVMTTPYINTGVINSNAAALGNGLGGAIAAPRFTGGFSALDQNVQIVANFPNATNHLEIEEAFGNLINLASQYANRKNMQSTTFGDTYNY